MNIGTACNEQSLNLRVEKQGRNDAIVDLLTTTKIKHLQASPGIYMQSDVQAMRRDLCISETEASCLAIFQSGLARRAHSGADLSQIGYISNMR
jgi:hypothetical protein